MTEEDLQAEVQASKKSKELQELADLEEAQRVQAKMDAETQRQIDLDALLARRLSILAEKLQQEERFLDEDKWIDVESLDHQYPIVEWQSFFLTTKPQYDQSKPDEDIYLNKVTRSNGHQRFFRTLMGVLSILDREDLKIIYELGDTADFWDTQQNWKLISWKLHSSSGVHTIMTSAGLVFHMLVENRYPLTKEVLSQMLELKLETEEESSMALELIKFVKQQLEEFEDSNDDDLVTSDHGEEERV
ncbi:hypothetical protein Tco_1226175 [Tanacetum coccineum]